MRITLLSKALVVGAYQRKCELIAENNDLELSVLVPPSWRTGRHVARLERMHTTGYALREVPLRFNGNFHLHFYPTLPRELKLSRPNILHIDEEPYNLATFQALRTAREQGARVLFFSWQNLMRQYPPPFRWFERYVFDHSQCAIAGSQEAAQVLRSKGFRREIDVIPQFGVDPEVFSPAPNSATGGGPHGGPHRSSNGDFTIGYVGRLVREKGVDLLLRALQELPPQAHLLAVGTGDELSHLRTLAIAFNVSERVRFLPVVPSSRMPAIYNQLDVLVLPSRTQSNWKEQFGRVLIEAMACGVPVMGSTSGEIPQVIGEAGLLFPEGDVIALRHQLNQLIDQPALCADLAQRGRARVLARYSMQRIADDTVAVYRRLMQAT